MATERNHQIRFYTMAWEGPKPSFGEVCLYPHKNFLRNVARKKFNEWVLNNLRKNPVDAIVGFNQMRGLDAYFSADGCFVERAYKTRSFFYRLTPRYHYLKECERMVCESKARILALCPAAEKAFIKYWKLPKERLTLLPPNHTISSVPAERSSIREKLGIAKNDLLLLMVGSNFGNKWFDLKGLDRVIRALASLPPKMPVHLLAVGAGKKNRLKGLLWKKGVNRKVSIIPARGDIPEIMSTADVFLHPARWENTGKVLLEAMASGLPVITTEICGYAGLVAKADGGIVLRHPFVQTDLNHALLELALNSSHRKKMGSSGAQYTKTLPHLGMSKKVIDELEKLAQ